MKMLSFFNFPLFFSPLQINEAEQIFKQFCDDKRLQNEFSHLKSNLYAHGYIVDKRLRTMIFEPFQSTQMTRVQKRRMFLQAAFDKHDINN